MIYSIICSICLSIYVYMYIVYVVEYIDNLFVIAKSDCVRKARNTIRSKLKVFNGC